jgi:hypothetical protein
MADEDEVLDPELVKLTEDDLFIEGAYMYKGEMPHEEVSKVIIKRKIKKSERDELARQLKKSYNTDRCNFISIEK